MCWGKNGGAGHVAIVERVDSNNQVYTSESGWNSSSIFWNQTRTNNNGRWGCSAGYHFRCFIYLPEDVQRAIDGNVENHYIETPSFSGGGDFNIGDKVIINGPLYTNANADNSVGRIAERETYITRKVNGRHPYNTTGDLGWMDTSSIRKAEVAQPAPVSAAPIVEQKIERKGLDISNYQNGINFDSIKNSEYKDFLILRAGFTGWGTGVSYNKDESFEEFYRQAKEKGIPVGAYWYSCANTYEKGVAEAEFMYENCLKGKQFEYPIFIDVEDTHWQVDNKDGVTAAIKGFGETLEKKHFYVGIYASDISGFKEKMNMNEVSHYDRWVARYGSSVEYAADYYGMWQTSSQGEIPGYSGRVDTNIAYRDYPMIMKRDKHNGFAEEVIEQIPEVKQEIPAPAADNSLKVGDTIRIIGTGNGNIYGTANAAFGIGWTRQILKIYEGRPYPYMVGNNSGVTGFYQESSLQKI